MKQICLIFLVAAVFVTSVAAVHPEKSSISEQLPDLTRIGIVGYPNEKLEYIGEIGSDLDTALDSLRKLKNISSEIIKVPLEVLFDYDDRAFFGIVYEGCGMYSDVLDTKGNYYLRTWHSADENKIDSVAASISPCVNREISNIRGYDLQGRRLSSPPVRGMYIQDKRVKIRDRR